jgi:hypothetical protein
MVDSYSFFVGEEVESVDAVVLADSVVAALVSLSPDLAVVAERPAPEGERWSVE